jgi:hypothetical protein
MERILGELGYKLSFISHKTNSRETSTFWRTQMRLDENGNSCPGTLGEYRDLCAAFGGEECKAVKFLDEKIATQGRDQVVVTPDSQMRLILMPMLLES